MICEHGWITKEFSRLTSRRSLCLLAASPSILNSATSIRRRCFERPSPSRAYPEPSSPDCSGVAGRRGHPPGFTSGPFAAPDFKLTRSPIWPKKLRWSDRSYNSRRFGACIIFAAQIAFQIRRMHNEELVLGGTFAEYDLYKRNTARLFREYTDDVDDFCSNL